MSSALVYRAAVLTVVLTIATPCFADLTFCNESDAKIHVSLGYSQRIRPSGAALLGSGFS
jgi:hypothetical protein